MQTVKALAALTVAGALLIASPSSVHSQGQSREIVFSTFDGESSLYVIDPSSGQQRALPSVGGDDGEPVWAPGGEEVAFVRHVVRSDYPGEARTKIVTVDAAGGLVRELTDGSALDTSPAWSPDGSMIVFTRYSEIGWGRLMTVDVMTGAVEALTAARSRTDHEAEWSPDGSRVVFTRIAGGEASLFSVRAEGPPRIRRLTFSERSDETAPTWSPDSRWILFMKQRFGRDSDICLKSRAGGKRRCLAVTRRLESSPAWGPSSRSFVFVRTPGDGDGDLLLADVSTGETKRLTRGRAQDAFPAWNPQGGEVAFLRFKDGASELHVVAADGSDRRRLTSDGSEKYHLDW